MSSPAVWPPPLRLGPFQPPPSSPPRGGGSWEDGDGWDGAVRGRGGSYGVRVAADQSTEHAPTDPRAVRFHFRQPPISRLRMSNEKSVYNILGHRLVVAVSAQTRLHVGAQAHVQPNYTTMPVTHLLTSRSFPGTLLKDLRSASGIATTPTSKPCMNPEKTGSENKASPPCSASRTYLSQAL